MKKLEGKVVVLVGASGGIGRVISQVFVDQGAYVVLAARTEAKLLAHQKVLGEDRTLVVPTDASDPQALDNLLATAQKTYGHVDAVVNSVGTWQRIFTTDPTTKVGQSADELYATVAKPSLLAASAAAKLFLEQGHGLIVDMGSHAATDPRLKGNITYAAAKAWALTVLRNMRHELLGSGVRIVSLILWTVNTEENAKLLDTPEKKAAAIQPEDIGQWIVDNFDNENIEEEPIFEAAVN